jgi:hypothetical protein
MAREATKDREGSIDWVFSDEELERFAALVRADERDRAMRENAYVQAEREACAKVCEDLSLSQNSEWEVGTLDCADAIRARGSK